LRLLEAGGCREAGNQDGGRKVEGGRRKAEGGPELPRWPSIDGISADLARRYCWDL